MISGNGDAGADPNRLVVITDAIANQGATAPSNERFFPLKLANFGEVLRGVSFTPGTRYLSDSNGYKPAAAAEPAAALFFSRSKK